MTFLTNTYFLLFLTFGIYFLSRLLQKKTNLMILNPILLCIAIMILFLKVFGIEYETYQEAGKYIDFWLKPAVVALGVPLYEQLKSIRKQILPIILSQLAGCIVGIISVTLIAKALGASREVILSLAPKSVTTPIAIEITNSIGGIPSLTAAVVIFTGLFGGIAGYKILTLCKVDSQIAQGISMGTASHALGTSVAMERNARHGAYASLGLIVNAVFTALLTPVIIDILGI